MKVYFKLKGEFVLKKTWIIPKIQRLFEASATVHGPFLILKVESTDGGCLLKEASVGDMFTHENR